MHTELEPLFERAIDACTERILSAGATITTPSEISALAIECDPDLMHQALTNLVRNAADAVADNSGTSDRTITIGTQQHGETVVLTIADTGPGMPDDVRQRMFNPFFTTRHAGTGLGLAIVHRIIDAHGGRIEVSNQPAGGARIAVVLPIQHQSNPPRGIEPAQPDRMEATDDHRTRR